MNANIVRQNRWIAVLGTLGVFCVVGCGGADPNQRLDKALTANGQTRATVAQFAGKVTIDGGAPSANAPVTQVMLYDPKEPKKGVSIAVCDTEGNFTFTTYAQGDGVPTGSYIVLFAQLDMVSLGVYAEPDHLKNLYNDPDKNATIPEFKVDVTPPGKSDYHFELALTGKDPVSSPGPHAITKL